jgi:hypothetical protein
VAAQEFGFKTQVSVGMFEEESSKFQRRNGNPDL